MRQYDAVLFDFDGVLVDSEPVHFECWNEILAPFGTTLEWSTYAEHCIGVTDRAMLQALCRHADTPIQFDDLWAEYPRKKELFRRRMMNAGAVAEEVLSLLKVLHRDFALAVVTSSGRREVEPILESAGILPLLGAVVYGDDVQRHKPAPDPYLRAVEQLGTSNALVVEDSDAGLAAGRAAGLDVLHIPLQTEMCALLREALRLEQN